MKSEGRSKARTRAYVAPWAACLALPVVSGIAYVAWGADPAAAPWWSMGILVAVTALASFTWRLLRARSEVIRWLGTGTVAAAGVWLIVASLVGPLTRPWLDIWGIAGPVICAAWNFRRASLNSDEPGGGGKDAGQSPLERVLAGAKIRRPRQVDGRVEARVETNRAEGQTIPDLQRSAESIEVVTGVRPGGVRIQRDPDDAGLGDLTIVPHDPLDTPITWPGPSRPGASVHEPLACGVYEDAGQALIWLTGDDEAARALTMWLVMGCTGAGKTQAMVTLMADVLTRREVSVIASDHVKGAQSLGPLLGDLEWYSTAKDTSRAMIAGLRTAIRDRANYLGQRELKQWEPGCGLNLVIAWFEEATELVADSTAVTLLVSQARSVGIVVIVSQQRASHQSIDTDARAQLNGNICFGVRDSTDAGFALPDDVVDAGARPELWQNRKPGYCYLVGPGIGEDRYAVPLRWYRASDDQIRAVLAEWRQVRTPLDEVTAAAFGKPYAAFKAGLGGGGQTSGPAPRVSQPAGGDAELADPEDDEEGLEPMPSELDPDIAVDPDAPVGPPPVDIPFGVPAPEHRLSGEEARQVVQQHLHTLMDQGRTHTQPADIVAMKPPTTRTREWVRQELHRLCDQPREGEIALERDPADDPGVFRIVALTGAVVG